MVGMFVNYDLFVMLRLMLRAEQQDEAYGTHSLEVLRVFTYLKYSNRINYIDP